MIGVPTGACDQTRNALRIPTLPTSYSANPNDLALKIIGRDYLSYSAVSTYQRCPLRFFFQYVEGRTPEFVSSNLVFGSAVHTAIERHYRCRFDGAATPGIDDLLAIHDKAWAEEADGEVRFGSGESFEKLRELASRMLTAFQAHEVSSLDTELLAVEEEFRGPIIPDCPDVLGRVDLVVAGHDALRIVDFKTSRSSWYAAKVAEAATQMLLYTALVAPLAKAVDLPVTIEWVILTKGKTSIVDRHELTPDPRQVERAKLVVRCVWQAIVAGHFYPNPSAMNCPSCPFQTACSQWEG